MKWLLALIITTSFALGALSTLAFTQDIQLPSPTGQTTAPYKAGPQDWIGQENIHVQQDHIRINIKNARWASFAPTGSMRPLLDQGANGIQIQPSNPQQIEIGDIITYDDNGRKIIHRVVDIQTDEKGIYYTAKGDNNPTPDAKKIRFEDVERILVAIIY